MEKEKIIKSLKEFTHRYDLKNKAVESCKVYMTNCLKEDEEGIGGFALDELKLDFVRFDLIFDHYLYGIPFVKTRIGIYKKEEDDVYVRGHESIGYYELDTDMEGESLDDWLVIDAEKNNQMDIIYDIKRLTKALPEKYLSPKSPYYDYITYLSHITMFYQGRKLRLCQEFMVKAFELGRVLEITKEFKDYFERAERYIKRIAMYLDQCDLLEADLVDSILELKMLKRITNHSK